MKKYEVIITAHITKAIIVDAESQDEAEATAHELFSSNEDGREERYFQDTDEVNELEELP